jgi:hypothetical protein
VAFVNSVLKELWLLYERPMRNRLTVTLVLLAPLLLSAQQPPRDTRRAASAGTATIAGVVVSDEASPRPLRRARVMLGGAALPIGRTAITHDDGTFAFGGLPAGRYTLGAAKEGYVGIGYGATRPGRRGSPIILRERESLRLTVGLPRGSVITGIVTTPDGQPAAGLTVSALENRYDTRAGERRLTAVSRTQAQTDDRGVYRIYGLAAGEYAVSAHVRSAAGVPSEMQALSAADIQRALAGQSAPPRRTVTFAPVFFPGTPVASQAAMVTLGKGEERTGVDIVFQAAPTARIEGAVLSPHAGGVNVSLSSRTTTQKPGIPTGVSVQKRVDPDGRFVFDGVPPGHYTLSASSWIPPAVPESSLWASTEVSVNGDDVSGVLLSLAPGLRLAGRVVFDGADPPAGNALRRSVSLTISGTTLRMGIPPLEIDADGTFVVEGIVPDSYQFAATSGLRAPVGGWWLKSIVIRGREALDAPLELRQPADDAIVTFSDRASALSGIVRDARGDPVADVWVVAFSTHPGSWFHDSRRVAAVKTSADGRYSIRNLPAGEYHLATVFDLEQGEWFDPVLLRQLAAAAMRITIADNEQKTVDPVFR